jgi:branched-chain amino acid transport system substrate-binding protein
MIETVSCDTKMLGSEAARCAAQFAYEDKVKIVIGPLSENAGAQPILREEKIWMAHFDFGTPVSPDDPYFITATPTHQVHHQRFLDALFRLHPEIETMVTINQNSASGIGSADAQAEWAEANGVEILASEFFEYGTTDFYPQLTKMLSKDPDCINLGTNSPGNQLLMIKQATELGFSKLMFAAASGAGVMESLGAEAVEGYVNGNMNWESPLLSEETRALALEYNERFPEFEGWLDFSVHFSFGTMNLFAAAIEQAGSIEPEAVRAAIDDPDFRFDYFGYESYMWGLESFGINSRAMVLWPFSVFENGEVKILEMVRLEGP